MTSNNTTERTEIEINVEAGIPALRRKLIAEYATCYERRKDYMDRLKPKGDATQADWDAFTGLAGTGTYAWLVSGVLRLLEQKHPETAAVVAEWVELSLDSGTDWLEDLNNDLPDEAFNPATAMAEGV